MFTMCFLLKPSLLLYSYSLCIRVHLNWNGEVGTFVVGYRYHLVYRATPIFRFDDPLPTTHTAKNRV